jgi:hypothetical protein
LKDFDVDLKKEAAPTRASTLTKKVTNLRQEEGDKSKQETQ